MKNKIIFMSLIFFIILIIASSIVKADSDLNIDLGSVITGAQNFASIGESKVDNAGLKRTSDLIYNTLFFIALAASVIYAGVLGTKFMIGSLEEKTQVKEALIPFVIGCIVVFGAFAIWKIIVTLGNNFI